MLFRSKHKERWEKSLPNWEKELELMKDFLSKRNGYIFSQLASEYGLAGTAELKIRPFTSNSCTYKVNSLVIDQDGWEGTYFRNIPVEILCIPKPGYRFVKWLGGEQDGLNCRVVAGQDTINLLAVLVKDDDANKSEIVINEIMYKPSDDNDCRDWIELFNNSDFPADLTAWEIKDSDDGHVFEFQPGTVLMPRQYLIISEDTSVFREFYGETCLLAGNTGFGFGRDDAIRLFDTKGNLVDIVVYSNSEPWDKKADGKGYSLELAKPDSDNELPGNWHVSSAIGGTPCQKNSEITKVNELNCNINNPIFYPNPVDGQGQLVFETEFEAGVGADLYDNLGRKVTDVLIHTNYPAGKYSIAADLSGYEKGLYFIRLEITYVNRAIRIIPVIIQ